MKIEQDHTNGEITLGDQRLVLHCNYYNIYLQKTLEDGLGDEMIDIQVQAAYSQTKEMFSNVLEDTETNGHLDKVKSLFSEMGLGKLDLTNFNGKDGYIELNNSHYAIACYSHFGMTENSVCLFPRGYILAILNEIFGLSLDISELVEIECLVNNPEEITSCKFEVRK